MPHVWPTIPTRACVALVGSDGAPCGEPPAPVARRSPVPLCELHLLWLCDRVERMLGQERHRMDCGAIGSRAEPMPEFHVPAEVVKPGQVVYYAHCPARRLVKIGTTTRLRQRLTWLRGKRPSGWLVLLHTEPGGYELERQRHVQFAEHHYTHEWFFAEPVIRFIEQVAS